MKLLYIALFSLGCCWISRSQTTEKKAPLNLDMETVVAGKAVGWTTFGNESYKMRLDSTTVKSGKYSLSISNTAKVVDYAAWSFELPNNYKGKKIKLSGFLKMDNVTNGFGGIWMRIDPSIGFDNMNKKQIKGTNDWKEFSVELEMDPHSTERTVLGGLLVGKGTIWIDDLKVSIDGKDISKAEVFVKDKFPADLDNEFAESSKIADFTPTAIQIENLKTLGLVWGFLKYHHPSIAKGNHNWDFELFRMIPKILAANTTSERDMALMSWIKLLGDVKEGKPETFKPEEVKLLPDLDWINQTGFSTELQTALNKIRNTDRSKEHYYIDFYPSVGNPDFSKETGYVKIASPDAGYRLLALFRYWNMVQYFFPDKHLINEDWKNVLTEFIPPIITAKDNKEYTITMLELIARIHDTHANVWGANKIMNAYWGKNWPSVEVAFIQDKAVVIDYYDDKFGEESQLKKGDIITKVNSKDVTEIIKEQLKRTAASNYPTQLRDIGPRLLRTNDSLVEVTYLRDNKLFTQTIKTYSAAKINIYGNEKAKDSTSISVDKGIVFLNHKKFNQQKDIDKLIKELKTAKGLIIDDRNYPEHFPLFQLGRLLVPKATDFVKFSQGSIKTPGVFVYTKPLNYGAKNSNYFKGKVVILVNEKTQSSAEYQALGYRASPNAIVMGSTTAGADGNVSAIILPGGIATMFSGIGVYYPDGRETQRVGIVPDIEVKPTIEGVKNGKDEVLDKAIQYINK